MSKNTPPKRRKHAFSLQMKLQIVQEAKECRNIRATARKYKIYPCQIRRWTQEKARMMEAIKKNPNAKTVHRGKKVEGHDTEQELLAWIKKLSSRSVSVSPGQVIEKALSIDENFHKGNLNALWKWIYWFLNRNGFCIRKATSEEQQLSEIIPRTLFIEI